jgi:diphosphomevalonate decarboxylase
MIKVTASPNIAFIKYWGKETATNDDNRNIGVNPSLSMTLSKSLTTVRIEKKTEPTLTSDHEIFIQGNEASPEDYKKISDHIQRIEKFFSAEFPAGAGALKIYSENNFPAAAGIASSASAFCALSIGITAAICGKEYAKSLMAHKPQTLSLLSRQGSGSAARSVSGGFMYWDKTHAEPIECDWKLYDTIVILSRQAKTISSSEGHKRALSSPYFSKRLEELPYRTKTVLDALKNKDIHALGTALETEALNMHDIAETSSPAVHYLSKESRKLIEAIQNIKTRDYYFTIDAGPNLHLISESPIIDSINPLLKTLGIEAEIWEDALGTGPSLE